MSLSLLFDYLGTRLNGPRAGTTRSTINWHFTDSNESAASNLSHGALTAVMGKDAGGADATVTVARAVFEAVILKQRTMADAIQHGDAKVTGDANRVTQLIGFLDDFDAAFPIVEPRRLQ
jgi:alkyl sulfatase BDS1-like metallo-beta-lactamase superfamily hydrolase